jgi:hypothetical protein
LRETGEDKFFNGILPMNNLEERVAGRIHEFDIISLLHLLMTMNYSPEEIRFRSYNSICSQSGLIHDIKFRQEPVREAVITMNMGLLGVQSPLPSYFRKKMESEEVGRSRLADFIGYFDHHLIRDYICNIYPEINRLFFPDWEMTKRRYLQILNLKSLGTLHWLFRKVFPEIGVQVENAVLNDDLQTRAVVLGKAVLGDDAVFGSKTSVPINGRRVTFYSEEEMTDTQAPWPREIRNRLTSLIFPVLQPAGIDLEIVLVLKSRKRWVRLHAETYLGYDRMQGGEESYRRIRIFRGHIGESFRTREKQKDCQPDDRIKEKRGKLERNSYGM